MEKFEFFKDDEDKLFIMNNETKDAFRVDYINEQLLDSLMSSSDIKAAFDETFELLLNMESPKADEDVGGKAMMCNSVEEPFLIMANIDSKGLYIEYVNDFIRKSVKSKLKDEMKNFDEDFVDTVLKAIIREKMNNPDFDLDYLKKKLDMN